MTSQKTILITGANRGVGRAITNIYLSRANHTIIALVRDPSNETCQSLTTESTGTNSSVILIAYDGLNLDSADKAITKLTIEHPEVTHLDTVIACAGFSSHFGPALGANAETYMAHYTVNTLGPLQLFRACLPLMTSTNTNTNTNTNNNTNPANQSTFIALSSAGGSIMLQCTRALGTDSSGKPRAGALPYGASKCALNHVMARLHNEYPEIHVGLFTPGPTKTGFGGEKVDWDVVPGAMDVETVSAGLVDQFDKLGLNKGIDVGETKVDKEDKRFALKDWKGMEIPW